MNHDETFLRRAAEARARVNQLQASELEWEIQAGALLVDVRESAETQKGTIRGSYNIPLSSLKTRIESVIPDQSSLVVCVCRSGNRSTMAAAELIDLGYKNVKSLAAGLEGLPPRYITAPEN
jgi:rhodanese-related sulfurtransferase